MAGIKGRYKFKTAEDLLAAVNSYFEWADANPVRLPYRMKTTGAEKPTKREKADSYAERPYTLQELSFRIGIGLWTNFKRDNAEREGFAEVIEYAENRVAAQQIVGAMVGLYRENLVARLNGIFDTVVDTTPPPSTIEIRVDE